jgi:RNA polymerase sigma-70 factor (ECF subfamily)
MPTDRELMLRVAERDEDAFNALVHRQEGIVRRRLAGLIPDRASVEDLLQEVLLRLWTKSDGYAGGSVKAWLLRIATNLALNHRRGRARRDRSLRHARGLDPDRVSAPESAAPGMRTDESERRLVLRKAVDGLPRAKREVVRRVHEEQQQLVSIAKEMGIPLGTVKSRLHYALRDLAKALREHEGE